MRRYSIPALLIVGVMSIFWSYTVIETLLTEFSTNINIIDLGTLVVLGFIAGLALGLIPAVRKNDSSR
jgi:H+/Cl- antiporter ClcA